MPYSSIMYSAVNSLNPVPYFRIFLTEHPSVPGVPVRAAACQAPHVTPFTADPPEFTWCGSKKHFVGGFVESITWLFLPHINKRPSPEMRQLPFSIAWNIMNNRYACISKSRLSENRNIWVLSYHTEMAK